MKLTEFDKMWMNDLEESLREEQNNLDAIGIAETTEEMKMEYKCKVLIDKISRWIRSLLELEKWEKIGTD